MASWHLILKEFLKVFGTKIMWLPGMAVLTLRFSALLFFPHWRIFFVDEQTKMEVLLKRCLGDFNLEIPQFHPVSVCCVLCQCRHA